MERRYYRKIQHISYKDHVTNEEVRAKIQQAIGPHEDLMIVKRRKLIIIIIINPLTARVVGASQMILQPVFSIFLCSPLPFGTFRTPGLSIP